MNTLLDLLANLAYILTLCAFVTRDMLILRGLFIAAQSLVIFYTFQRGVYLITRWNVVFLLINVFMAIQILRERRAIVLPADLKALYEHHFSALTPAEFLRWWRQGHRERIEGQSLARVGERPAWLYFLLSGSVRVSRNRSPVFELPAGYFVAEMSLLTGEPANADVHAIGEVEVVRWATDDLRELRQKNPTLWTKIQSVIGHDLVEKIRLGEIRAGHAG